MEGASVKDYSANMTYASRYNGAGLTTARGGAFQAATGVFLDIEFTGGNQRPLYKNPQGVLLEYYTDLTQWERDTLEWYWSDSTYKTGGVGSRGKWLRLPPGQHLVNMTLGFYANLGPGSRFSLAFEQMTDGNTTPHPNGDDGDMWRDYLTQIYISNEIANITERQTISITQLITNDCGSSRIWVPLCRSESTVTTQSVKLAYVEVLTLD